MANFYENVNVVFDDYNEFWKWFFILHAICSTCYGLVFYIMFTNAEKKGESPKNCLLIATCTISTIHSHICCIGVVVGFFVDQLYLPENYMISPPGAISIMWMLWTSYMLTDLTAHIICFMIKPIPYRLDVIAHHTFAYTTVYFLNFPTPIYGWLILCAPLITEFSTIFMNFRWFAKHYGYSKRLQYHLNSGFILTWFLIRLPAILSLLVYLIWNWHAIYRDCPSKVAISGTVLIICINLLHVIWAYLLINKIMRNKKKKELRLNSDYDDRSKERGDDILPTQIHANDHRRLNDRSKGIGDDDKNGTETDSLL